MTALTISFLTLLVIGAIYCFVKIFVGKKILEVNSDLGTHSIEITENGYYSVWIRGRLFKQSGVDVRKVTVNDQNDEEMRSHLAILTPQSNGLSHGSMMLKYYYLKKGTYNFIISEGKEPGLNFLSKLVSVTLPENKQPTHSYILKKTFPDLVILVLIPVIGLSVFQIFEILTS